MAPQAYRSRRRWKKNSTVNKMVLLTLDTVATCLLGKSKVSLLSWPLSLSLSLSSSPLSFATYMSTLLQYGRLPSPFAGLLAIVVPSTRFLVRPLVAKPPSLLFEHSCNRPTGREHFVRTLSSTRRLQITCIRRYRFRDRCRGREVLGGRNVPVFNGKMLGLKEEDRELFEFLRLIFFPPMNAS